MDKGTRTHSQKLGLFLMILLLFGLGTAGGLANTAAAGNGLSPALAATPTRTPGPKGSRASPRIPPTFRTIMGDPVQILVATDGSAQVNYNYVPPVPPFGQFYPASQNLADMGVFLWIGTSAYGPDLASRGSAYGSPPLPFTQVSQSAVTGSGTAADPWVVRTVLGAGATGVQITESIIYVNGQQYYRMNSQISNASGVPVTVTYFHAGDIYLKGSDAGYGYYNASTGGVGGKNTAQTWYVVFQPITPATKYEEDDYSTIWDDIGHLGAQGPGLHNTVRLLDNIDNGAGLQWSNVSIAAGQSTTISDYLSFGTSPVAIATDTPTPTNTPGGPTPTKTPPPPPPTPTPKPPAEVPEADTLLLFGGGIGGLATWVGWQWRKVRARSKQ
jgi:hypothetical protein